MISSLFLSLSLTDIYNFSSFHDFSSTEEAVVQLDIS